MYGYHYLLSQLVEIMLNMTPLKNAKRAEEYFGKSDGGYYLKDGGLLREWGGKLASRLALDGTPELEQLRHLLQGRDPHSGKQLTAKLIDKRLAGWDLTASLPKGVTTLMECGDDRVSLLFHEANREAMEDVERIAVTRVRRKGQAADRLTGNMAWLAVEHCDTRPSLEDGKPDWDRHIHNLVFNATWDEAEGKIKALKVRDTFDLRKYFSHAFDARMSKKLTDAGYEIETKLQADEAGGRKFKSWDVKAAPGHEAAWQSINDKNSRRTVEIEAKEAELNAQGPKMSKRATGQLAKTTRQRKREDLTLDDMRRHWQSRITPDEGRAIEETIRRARDGENGPAESKAAEAMAYAIAHHFQRNSVVKFTALAVTAMERGIGSVLPEELRAEAARQGVLFSGRDATTQAVLGQEQKIIGFARMGKGCFRPLAPDAAGGLADLSPEQRAAVRHVWQSTDQVMLVRGGAGTGKTTMMRPAIQQLGCPVALLAPSADASRTVLRGEGFSNADTVAAFLLDEKRQEAVAGGGIIWVDEAGLLAINDLEKLCQVAERTKARLVLQGDPKQHKAVDRHGNMLEVLEDYAGLPVAKLTKIQRQKGDYAGAVALIRDGELGKGDAVLRKLGWVVEGNGHDALVAEYALAIKERKANGELKTVLVVDPTHKDGDKLTERLREVRREKGLITGEEQAFDRLSPLGWTDAQKSDAARYAGDEVIQFHSKGGRFKAGDRVKASELLPELATVKPSQFAVYRQYQTAFAVGDTLRITGNGWDVTKKHRIDNGRMDTVAGFTDGGDIRLGNGWVLSKDFAHMKHGLVLTSHATQGKTEDVVLAAMRRDSMGAMSAEQAYVTISRGRERGMIFTDMAKDELLEAIRDGDQRKSATELFQPRPPQSATPEARPDGLMRQFMERVRDHYRQLRQLAGEALATPAERKGLSYGH